MKRIVNGRGSGKTQKLIEFAAIRGLPIFAANPAVSRIRHKISPSTAAAFLL